MEDSLAEKGLLADSISQVLINGIDWRGSLILLGSVDASKTVFLQESNTIVVTSGLYHSMQIIPKDRFNNPASVCQEYLTAEIRKVS